MRDGRIRETLRCLNVPSIRHVICRDDFVVRSILCMLAPLCRLDVPRGCVRDDRCRVVSSGGVRQRSGGGALLCIVMPSIRPVIRSCGLVMRSISRVLALLRLLVPSLGCVARGISRVALRCFQVVFSCRMSGGGCSVVTRGCVGRRSGCGALLRLLEPTLSLVLRRLRLVVCSIGRVALLRICVVFSGCVRGGGCGVVSSRGVRQRSGCGAHLRLCGPSIRPVIRSCSLVM